MRLCGTFATFTIPLDSLGDTIFPSVCSTNLLTEYRLILDSRHLRGCPDVILAVSGLLPQLQRRLLCRSQRRRGTRRMLLL